VGKVFQGGSSGELLGRLKKAFREVKHVKPPASRSESVELYVVATGFKCEARPAAPVKSVQRTDLSAERPELGRGAGGKKQANRE
jgi:hypothetical protein